MTIKKHDFIEIDYTGKVEDMVFDTTSEKAAKDNNIFNQGFKYKPMVICIGENMVIKGLDTRLEGKEENKEYDFKIPTEEAFGKKDPKLLRMVPMSIFKEQNINPMPGLQVNIDGMLGTIRTVGGGRAIIDFNHPLSGKDVEYKVKINKLITGKKEKLDSYLNYFLGDINTELTENKAKVFFDKEIDEKVKGTLKNKCKELLNIDLEFLKRPKADNKETKG
ncbi:peptidylprolyl isomerase [Candidatus Woesearchaeota archaeon]|nr:peptidylprolyl isomerase [Candidatus Woesearchaeota archaeon]|tara:strand:+ start:14511 stop:15173 length:663 start_codon:yes stop_codon:yes gene_type:complete